MKVKVKQRDFYAKAVTRIAPKVEQPKKAYKRKDKHRENYSCYSRVDRNSGERSVRLI